MWLRTQFGTPLHEITPVALLGRIKRKLNLRAPLWGVGVLRCICIALPNGLPRTNIRSLSWQDFSFRT